MRSNSKMPRLLMTAACFGALWTLAAAADTPASGQPQAGAIPAPQHQVSPPVVHTKAPPHHPGVTPANAPKKPAPPAQ